MVFKWLALFWVFLCLQCSTQAWNNEWGQPLPSRWEKQTAVRLRLNHVIVGLFAKPSTWTPTMKIIIKALGWCWSVCICTHLYTFLREFAVSMRVTVTMANCCLFVNPFAFCPFSCWGTRRWPHAVRHFPSKSPIASLLLPSLVLDTKKELSFLGAFLSLWGISGSGILPWCILEEPGSMHHGTTAGGWAPGWALTFTILNK